MFTEKYEVYLTYEVSMFPNVTCNSCLKFIKAKVKREKKIRSFSLRFSTGVLVYSKWRDLINFFFEGVDKIMIRTLFQMEYYDI